MFKAAVSLTRRLRTPAAEQNARGAALWDLGLAGVLTVASFMPQLAGNGLQLGQLAVRHADAWTAVLTLGQCLPLAVRRRCPAVCLAVVAVSFAAYQSLGYRSNFAGTALFIAVYSAGAHIGTFRRASAAAATAGYVALAVSLHRLRSPERLIDYGTFYIALLACWGAGTWMRARQAAETGRRREGAQQAIAAERAHIAREIHDVVTHHVTAIVVQADSAQHLLGPAPDRAAESLTAISGTGRRALAELRHLLGVLDDPEATAGLLPARGVPAPSTGEAGAGGRFLDLVERIRLAGQPVELFEYGEQASMAAAPELAVYRVVQEALTNAVKHAPGRPTVVKVHYGEEVRVDVTNEGPAAGAFTPGRGLTGLRERVRLCGGELSAGGLLGGGFGVSARIPSGAAS